MTSFILDLRNNPGGLLDVAVDVAGTFLEKDKLVVSTKGRKSSQNMEFLAKDSNPYIELPVAVLINEGSASGSEIVAGCLQDYKRAIIIGTKSFGKGSVQTVIPLGDGSALRLTTSKYYTPSNKIIHGKGVEPDITVEEGKIELAAKPGEEKDVNEIFEQIEKKTAEQKKEAEQKKVFDYKSDNQLMQAVDILKAITIYKGMNSK